MRVWACLFSSESLSLFLVYIFISVRFHLVLTDIRSASTRRTYGGSHLPAFVIHFFCGVSLSVAQFCDQLWKARRTSWTYILQTARSLFPKTCTEIHNQVPQHWPHNSPLDDSPVWHATPGTMPPRQKSYYGSGDTVNLKEIAGSQQPPHPLSRRRASNVLITGLLGSTSATTRKEAIESKADFFSRCPCLLFQALAVPFLPSSLYSHFGLLPHVQACFVGSPACSGSPPACPGCPPGYLGGPPAHPGCPQIRSGVPWARLPSQTPSYVP